MASAHITPAPVKHAAKLAGIRSEEMRWLASAEHPLRRELWKLYDESVGSFAQRSRRTFWQVYPD